MKKKSVKKVEKKPAKTSPKTAPKKTSKKEKQLNRNICQKTIAKYLLGIVALGYVVFLLVSTFFTPNSFELFLEDTTQNTPTMYAVLSKDCTLCSIEEIETGLKKTIFSDNLEVKTIFDQKETQEFLQAMDAKTLPFVFFNKEIENYEQWERIKSAFISKTYNDETYYVLDNAFILSPKQIIDSKLLNQLQGPTLGNTKSQLHVYLPSDFSSKFYIAVSGNQVFFNQLQSQFPSKQPFISTLINDYITTNQIQLHFILMNSKNEITNNLHSALLCADTQDVFAPLKNEYINNYPKYFESTQYEQNVFSFMEKKGVNLSTFSNCLKQVSLQENLIKNSKILKEMGITGSPNIIIGDVILSGIPDYPIINALINQKLHE
jgi:protein-disulfide isomerase